ncbi:hypothetical protein BGX31_007971 [Mortierella sp. GBA43]|nr:hypothetical protein BGX31_007971 [Mortierella sp. GBA43]
MFTTLYQTTSGGYFISNYDTETGSWLSDATVPVQESMNQFAPPIAVPHNDLVYITDSTKMNILSMNNRNVRSLDIPPNTLNVNSLRGGGVHSGDSILYFGGQSAPGGKPQEVVTAFNLVSESWNNLVRLFAWLILIRGKYIYDSGNTIVLFGGTLLNGTVPTNASRAIYILDRVSLMWRQGPLAPSPRTQMACTAVGTQFVAWGGSDGQGIVPGPPIIYDLSKNQWVSSYIAHDKEEDSMQQKIIVIGAAAGGLMVITMALVEYIYQFRKKERDQERSKLEQQVQDRMISEGDRVNREKSTTTRRMSDSGSDLEYGMEEYYRPEEIIPFPGCYYLGNSKDSIERSPHTSIDCILIPARNPPIQPSSNARNPHGRPKTPTSTPLTSTNQVIPQRGIYALGIACQPRPVM